MTRKECLDMATQCVLQDRASQYGGMEDNFGRIANFWSVYLGRKVYPADVAAMMALLKIARAKANPRHGDNWIDLAGYAACAAECASNCCQNGNSSPKAEGCEEPEFKPGDKVRVFFCGKEAQNGIYLGEGPEGMKSWTCRVKTDDGEEGVCAKSIVKKLDWACSEQEFKFGDKVQADIGPKGKWEDAIYCRKDLDGMHLVKHDIDDEIVFQAREVRPCPMPKAEGCESLVEHDAPQTPAELCRRIVDCNPATYGHPHKPTGEELAEMAQEDAHG